MCMSSYRMKSMLLPSRYLLYCAAILKATIIHFNIELYIANIINSLSLLYLNIIIY